MSLLERPGELRRRLESLANRHPWRVAFMPSGETDFIRYFPGNLWDDFKPLTNAGLDISPYSDAPDSPPFDIVLLTAHGSDKSPDIWRIRQRFPNALVCVWFWDNHYNSPDNARTAVAADLNFASHAYAADNIINLQGALAGHVPACSAQWTLEAAGALYNELENRPRSNQLLVNYVDYEFSWRSALLRRLKVEAPETDVFLMPPDNRRRYFDKSQAERMREWMGYKSALCLPVDRDLSTRVFDTLLAGQIPVMPQEIPDMPQVISPDMEARLGIVRLPDNSVAAIRQAVHIAARRFDEGGIAGARARHEFVHKAHMLVHRVENALASVRQLATGHASFQVGAPPHLPFGLYVSQVRTPPGS